MSEISFKMVAATDVGLVRTNNEDNFTVNPDLTGNDWSSPAKPDDVIPLGENGCVMVVADGMGGMNAGEVASELAVKGIRRSFEEVSDFSHIIDTGSHIETFLKKAIVRADGDIKKRVKEDPSTSGMGTTIVIAWIVNGVIHVAWCGDSRAYLFNSNSGLSRLSRDHSYVQQLVDSGKLDAELAFDHPNSNIITRSLGDFNSPAQPDYISKGLSGGDMIILCSDGLCGLVRDEEMLDILNVERDSIEEYLGALFDGAINAGGYDNITIALMQCVDVKVPELENTLATTIKPTQKRSKAWIVIAVLAALIAAGAYFAGTRGLLNGLQDAVNKIITVPTDSVSVAQDPT